MAYNIHYRSTAVSKNGNTYQLDIYDNGYVGSIIDIPVSANPFVIKANASSDNQFEPLLASELRVTLDITDNQFDFIDFANEDQFKYFGKLTYSGNLVFQGWLLPDAMATPFSTGRIECAFSFIDGLAMLKSIFYTPTNPNITVLESTKQTILNCLNALNYPFGYKINVAVSIFASDMGNRTADIKNEPLSQSYMSVSNWFNSEQITTPNIDPYYFSDYISCYDILNYIMLAWGCQLYQSNGEWYVANVNEMASDNIYLTKYDEGGAYISAANQSINYTVKPYSSDNYLHFVDNTQAKILRQGFSQIYFKTPCEFPVNAIDNGYLRRLVSGLPESWLATTNLAGTASFHIGDIANYYDLGYGTGSFDSYAALKSISTQRVHIGDTMNISFKYKITSTPLQDKPICYIRLHLVDGATTYYYDNDKTFKVLTSGLAPQYYQATGDLTELRENSFSVETTQFPITAQYYFWIYVQPPTLQGPATQDQVQFSQFAITFSNQYSYQLDAFQKNAKFQNRKTVNGYLGAGFVDNFNAIGAILNYYGNYTYTTWYLQGDTTFENAQMTLIALVAENYYFIQSKAQINVEGSLMSLMSKKTGASTTTHLGLFSSIKIEDTTSGPNSLTGRYYILGNCEFDLINDILSNVTLLETSKTRIESVSKNVVFTVN